MLRKLIIFLLVAQLTVGLLAFSIRSADGEVAETTDAVDATEDAQNDETTVVPQAADGDNNDGEDEVTAAVEDDDDDDVQETTADDDDDDDNDVDNENF